MDAEKTGAARTSTSGPPLGRPCRAVLTAAQVALRLGITRQAVQQLEARALLKMRRAWEKLDQAERERLERGRRGSRT